MKYIIFFCILLFALPGLAQKGEVIRDSVRIYVDTNECGQRVWWAYTFTQVKGLKSGIKNQPIGYSESNPCANILEADTSGLVQAILNGVLEFDGVEIPGLIDYGRQQATFAKNFIYQPRRVKTYGAIDKALKDIQMPGIFATVEKAFADSLVGNYILVRPGVANLNVTVNKTAQGNVRIRLAANSFLPITVYSDGFITVRNIAGANQDVDLYQIEPGRWVSLLGNYQLVKNVRQVVQRSVK